MATVYIAPTAQGSADGTSAANAYAYSSLNTAETDAGNGGTILFLDGTYTFSGNQTWNAGALGDMTYKSLNDYGAYLVGQTSHRDIYLGSNSTSTLKVEGFKSANVSYVTPLNQTATVLTLNKILHADTISSTRPTYGIFYGGADSVSGHTISNSSFSLDYSGTSRVFRSAGGATVSFCTFQINCSSVGSGGITSFPGTASVPTSNNSIFASDNQSAIADITIDSSKLTNCCVYNMHTNDMSGGTDNIFQDPQLVDPANGDLRLRPTSPCIGAGTSS
jgi:hypothetical protein